ncbi:MAG: metallophosphoesterase [Desulfobulbaceae bacterium]|nr:metallophosphoesterase [Desulfobulbaceae bacterium]
MNILHISDLHFGPRHWEGDDLILLEKLNSYQADIVINTGDSTTDGLEDEYAAAGQFLTGLTCKNVISIIGNHDKRNMRSHELFQKYIDSTDIITLPETVKTSKKHLFLNREITKVRENFTDINFIKSIVIDGKSILLINIDSNELYNDNGFVEKAVLDVVSEVINQATYDLPLLLTHYSILGTDDCPLKNSSILIDFVQKHKIEYVFCGHTHELELMRTNDLYLDHTFFLLPQNTVGLVNLSNGKTC